LRTAIATVSLSGTLEEKLDAAAAAGFDAIELFEPDLLGSRLSPAAAGQLASDLGLAVAMYQPFRDFEGVAPDVLEANLRRARHKFEVMAQLGTDLMLVCSSVAPDTSDDPRFAAAQLGRLADEAQAHGMRIAYEALAWGRHVDDYRAAWRIVEMADHPALGTCLDSFHILSRGSDPSAIRDIPADRIFFLQLADAPVMAMDVLQWSRHHRCFPGQGGFDLAGFVEHVLAAGYDGPLSLEVFNDHFRQADPYRIAVDGRRSLLALEEAVGTSALPPRASLAGLAFVELAVGAGSAEQVATVLEAMGFDHVGPHRSKPVHQWRRRSARVLLNHGDEHAGSDPLVVALGLETDDPAAGAQRAQSLGAPLLPRRRGTGEADLAAVAAPDDTAVFFCRTAAGEDGWLGDFVELGDAASPAGAGITAVDHVVLSQPFDYFDEAALFYRSVLGLEPRASQDLVSPDGILLSRALTDRERRLRLAITVPRLAGGDHGRLGELQHVAFATDDALGAARAMRERGVPLLAIPDNYYDDLLARTDLPAPRVEQMRELGVLHDADASGALLHFFTAMIGDRLFFEVVQRIGSYDGYGAANSPVRLSAQLRGPQSATPSPQPPSMTISCPVM
jgi:4-hydroxyphenylpyruvate dioxygenase